MEREYRGQTIIAAYHARMIPPTDNYPDCECEIVLTTQHLYVLEDNYDGTYETHFEFVIREIDNIEIEQEKADIYSGDQSVSASTQILTAMIGLLAGALPTGGGNQHKKVKRKFFVIRYHDMQGDKSSIYFHLEGRGAKEFIRAFHKMREQ